MQANLYATFRMIAHVKHIPLDFPQGADVMQVVHEIIRKFPVLQEHWLNRAGELHAHVHILINGRDLSTLPDGLLTHLAKEDSIDFFPPVAGGGS